jgi:hypothetical protein
VAITTLLMATGDHLEVEASYDEVIKELENAARSSHGTLARLRQAGTGSRWRSTRRRSSPFGLARSSMLSSWPCGLRSRPKKR